MGLPVVHFAGLHIPELIQLVQCGYCAVLDLSLFTAKHVRVHPNASKLTCNAAMHARHIHHAWSCIQGAEDRYCVTRSPLLLQVDANLSLGLAMLLLGHAIDPADLSPPPTKATSKHRQQKDRVPTACTTKAVWAWGAASGLFIFPMVTLVTAFALIIIGLTEADSDLTLGLILLSACPVGKHVQRQFI